MAAYWPALTDWQYEFRGLRFGRGTGLWVTAHPNLHAAAAVIANGQLPQGDGFYVGPGFLEGHPPAVLVVRSADPDVPNPSRSEVETAFRPGGPVEHELFWRWGDPVGGQTSMRRVRVGRKTAIADRLHWQGRWGFVLELIGADPRYYGAEVELALIDAAGAAFGFDWDVDWDVDWVSGTGDAGMTFVDNTGTEKAWPTMTFRNNHASNDLESVEVTNMTNGDTLEVVVDVAPGQTLTVDMDAYMRATGELVVYIGTANREGSWLAPRLPFGLDPGGNTLRFEHTGPVTAVDLDTRIMFHPTYI